MEEKKEAGKHEHHEHHEHSEHDSHHELKIDNDPDKVISKLGTKMKKNPWMIVSLVLGVIVIIFLIVMLTGTSGVGGVSKDVAGKNVLDFANAQGAGATLTNVNDKGAFYEVNLSIQGKNLAVYVTKDGKNMISTGGLIPLTASTGNSSSSKPDTPATVPKADKPKVDLYVFAYCPFGTQAEKGMIPVYDALKNQADFNIIYIGAMHGEFEHVESLRQICILKNYNKDKLISYLKAFDTSSDIGTCQGTDTCVNPLIDKIFANLSINNNTIANCMVKDAPALYDAEGKVASSLGISGSPTLVINGVEIPTTSDYKYYLFNDQKIPFSRDANTYKTMICSLFNKAPAACSQTLSTASPSSGFGGSAGTASTGTQCATP